MPTKREELTSWWAGVKERWHFAMNWLRAWRDPDPLMRAWFWAVLAVICALICLAIGSCIVGGW